MPRPQSHLIQPHLCSILISSVDRRDDNSTFQEDMQKELREINHFRRGVFFWCIGKIRLPFVPQGLKSGENPWPIVLCHTFCANVPEIPPFFDRIVIEDGLIPIEN